MKKQSRDGYQQKYPIDDARQARLWQEHVQWVSGKQQWSMERPALPPRQETAQKTAQEESKIRNPWVENLPQPVPRRRHRVAWALLMAVAVVLSIGVYSLDLGRFSLEIGDPFAPAVSELEQEIQMELPTIEGGETRLQLAQTHGEALTAKEVYRKVNPAVVTVTGDLGNNKIAVGTGVLFTEDGFFITNAHVIDRISACTILTSNGKSYDAHLVGYDEERDLAVLKAIGATDLPVAEFGDSNAVEVGDKVYAIGNPLGLELRGTLTDGIISALDRDVHVDGHTLELIQTNAAINVGNSGGPLINEYGQVIGINTIKMSAGIGEVVIEGLGFAIPSHSVKRQANQILEFGKTLPDSSIGILVAPLAENNYQLQGLLIHSVTPGSCAETAGLRMGDVILEAEGVRTLQNSDLLDVRRELNPGDEMKLKILRGNEEIEVVLILDEAV